MIGTLVVQLPCAQGHTGGQLTVRHKGKSHTHNFAEGSDRSLQFAAFFADCEHELRPITSGMRLVLVYNLVWVGTGPAPTLQDNSMTVVQLKQALKAWEAELAAGGKQKRIAFLLEHEYTEANLRFEHLKRADRAMVRALSSCRGFEAHLTLVKRTVVPEINEYEDDLYPNKRCRYGYGYDEFDEEDEDEDEDEEGEQDDEGSKQEKNDDQDILDEELEISKFIARDGTSVDFRIDPERLCEKDFWDPEDKSLFNNDGDPDDEEENYTGNEGATKEQIYRRTLLVVWPRSQAVAHAVHAGFSVMQSLLAKRLQAVAALQQQQGQAAAGDDTSDQQQRQQQQQGGQPAADKKEAHKLQRAHKELLQVLNTCANYLQQRLRLQQQSQQVSTGEVAAVLQQGVKAAQLAVPGADNLVHRLVAAVAGAPSDVLSDNAIAAALASAAEVLDAPAVAPVLQRLVTNNMASQPSSCTMLIRGVPSKPQVQQQLAAAALASVEARADTVPHLLSLAVAIPGLPAVQQEAVDKATAAVQADGSAQTAVAAAGMQTVAHMPQLQQGLTAAVAAAVTAAGPVSHLSSCAAILQACRQQTELRKQFVQAVAAGLRSSSAVWQASTAVQLHQLLQDAPDLRKVLAAAISETLFVNQALLGAQTDDSMLQLSSMLLSDKQLRAAYDDLFAAAVAKRAGNYALLKQLVQSGAVQEASTVPEVQQLVRCQVANLERLSAVPPFNWNMPEATFPASAQVEAFLRGPESTLTLTGYSGIGEARKAAQALLPPKRATYGMYGHSNQYESFYSPVSCSSSTYSFTLKAEGIGKAARLIVSKTRGWWDSQLLVKEAYRQELQAVRALQSPVSRPAAAEVIVID